jgi:hypothetical protein
VFWLKLGTPIPSVLLNKQVQEAPHWKEIFRRNGGRTSGLLFAPTALAAYFRPDAVTRNQEWPFLDFRFPQEPILWLPPLPVGGAYVERLTSVTTTMPLPWIVTAVLAVAAGVEACSLAAARRTRVVTAAPAPGADQWMLVVGLLTSAAAMAALTVTTVGITNRYLSDFFATSAVGIALGHRIILPFLARRPMAAVAAGMGALVLVGWSVIVTLALTTRLILQ